MRKSRSRRPPRRNLALLGGERGKRLEDPRAPGEGVAAALEGQRDREARSDDGAQRLDRVELQSREVVEAVEQEMARRPWEYRNLDAFIIRTIREVMDDGLPPYQQYRCWARPTPWGSISQGDLNVLATGLMKSKFRLMMPKEVARRMTPAGS